MAVRETVARGSSQRVGSTAPGAAARGMLRAPIPTSWIAAGGRAQIVLMPAIFDPLPGIAEHVMQSPRVRLIAANDRCLPGRAVITGLVGIRQDAKAAV